MDEMVPKLEQATRITSSIAILVVAMVVIAGFWQVQPADVLREVNELQIDMHEIQKQIVPSEEHIRWRKEFFKLNPTLNVPVTW